MVVTVAAIAERIAVVKERIAAACRRAGRDPSEVVLVAVSKSFAPEVVVSAFQAGLRDFAENRVQEAEEKIAAVRAAGVAPAWHLVGHLQSNKAKRAAALFAMIHSIDSLRVAEALSRHAQVPLPAFLEVNVAQEPTKSGVEPDAVAALCRAVRALPNLEIVGLMTVAPQSQDREAVRPVFRRLRLLRDAVGLRDLSMGMSDDFEVAIEEGATHVRIGRAIFGPRPG